MIKRFYISASVLLTVFLISLIFYQTPLVAAERVGPFNKISEIVSDTPEYASNQVLVKFKKERIDLSSYNLVSYSRELSFRLFKGISSEDEIKEGNIMVYRITNGTSVEDVVNRLRSDVNVEYAEPNYYRFPTTLSIDDTYKNNLWGLDNFGQTLTLSDGTTYIGTAGADINITDAWEASLGTTEVIVAVIDTGVAYNHPDLAANMWDGTNCVDENGDALGGCLYGYDFGDTDVDPLPTSSSHGTHVAGTIAAVRNNSRGISGIGPQIKIMGIKTSFLTSETIKAIDFARQNGARVINASYGGGGYNSLEREAIDRFLAAGGIFVAAAGNEATDNDEATHNYPSDYNLANIISVAATDQNDELASFSNFGTTSVDVAAPGVNIYSTWAEAALFEENFDSLAGGTIPVGWVSDGNSAWGTYNFGGTGPVDNVLYADLESPYLADANSVLTGETVDLSSVANAKFEFFAQCDTEDTDPYGVSSDYMALEISSDGVNYDELLRWNTYFLEELGGHNYYTFGDELALQSQYFTANFKFRFRWVTNGSGFGGGDGCLIENLKILTYTDGADEEYEFANGTSMATPHVAGLAAYLWSAKPTATMTEIINAILDNGDTLPTLVGKIATGSRVNAYSSILSLGITVVVDVGPSIAGLADDPTPRRSKTWNWTSDNPDDVYRYSVDQSVGSTLSGSFGSTNAVTISDLNGTYYLHVQAKDTSDNIGPATTVSFILDNTGPTATIEDDSLSGFTLNMGELIYNSVGESLADSQDLSTYFTPNPSSVGVSSAVYNSQKIYLTTSNAIAGGRISLNIGDSSTNLFDSLGNSSTTMVSVFNGENWFLNPSSLNVGVTYLPDLFTAGLFSTTPGSTPDLSLKVTVTDNVILNIGSTAYPHTINIPESTDISEYSDQDFNAFQLQSAVVDTGSLSNFIAGYTPSAAIQWGIPSLTMKFNNSLTIRIYVGTELNGQTLNIYRSPLVDSGWTDTGISSPTCVVADGYCQFTTTQASYYVAGLSITPTATPSPTSAPSNNNNVSNNSVSVRQEHGVPQCTDMAPLEAPDLFKIIITKGKAKLIYTPVKKGNVSGYAIYYGLKKGDERFATTTATINNNEGEQSVTIGNLNPRLTYHFKIMALNGCNCGPSSDWIPAKASGNRTINKYRRTLLGKVYVLSNQYK